VTAVDGGGARERVLRAVRAGLGDTPPAAPTAIEAEARALLEMLESIRPRLPATDLAEAFAAQVSASRVGAIVERVASLSELPEAVRRYLDGHGLPASAALQPHPELQALDWSGVETHAAIAPDEAVGVGLARWGIAETGSLVFHSGPDTPILLNFLPLHHLVAVRAESILAHLEDYAAAAAALGPAPRNALLVTGASGTTDIEGSYVRGAHGPGYLHVVLVEGRRA
jgi:L-lactate dehydrogenase complex protein LldG